LTWAKNGKKKTGLEEKRTLTPPESCHFTLREEKNEKKSEEGGRTERKQTNHLKKSFRMRGKRQTTSWRGLYWLKKSVREGEIRDKGRGRTGSWGWGDWGGGFVVFQNQEQGGHG